MRAEPGDRSQCVRKNVYNDSMSDYQALEDAADVILAREATAVLRDEGDGRRHSLAEVIADVFADRTDAA